MSAEEIDGLRHELAECQRVNARLRAELAAAHKFMDKDAEDYDVLRALATDLRNQLYLLGQDVKEADAILLGKTAKEEQ